MHPDSYSNPGESKSQTSRRRFLKVAIVGAAGASLGSGWWLRETQAAGHAGALLLSCMDYRLIDDTEHYMERRGLKNKYDHIILPGAALGVLTDKYPDWNKTFWEELGLAINLHHIRKVMLLDHRDCGAYKELLGEDFAKHPKKEREAHAAQLKGLRELINEKHSELEVETLLMSLNGAVEKI